MNHSIKFSLFMFFISFIAIGAEEAMFGLQWNMSPNEVEAMGINITQINVEGNFYLYKTTSLPKQPSIAEEFWLTFYKNAHLIEIYMISTPITGDVYGTEGKEKFDHLRTLLSKKYSLSKNYCYVGRAIYKKSNEFYQCLGYEGCGAWCSFLKSDNKNIKLELKGLRRGKGFILLTVESVPYFEQAVNSEKNLQIAKDEEAF